MHSIPHYPIHCLLTNKLWLLHNDSVFRFDLQPFTVRNHILGKARAGILIPRYSQVFLRRKRACDHDHRNGIIFLDTGSTTISSARAAKYDERSAPLARLTPMSGLRHSVLLLPLPLTFSYSKFLLHSTLQLRHNLSLCPLQSDAENDDDLHPAPLLTAILPTLPFVAFLSKRLSRSA